MAEKDIAEKNLEAWNDVFADIVNVLLFDGKEIIKENDLVNDTVHSQLKADGKIHEQERDTAKFWKNGEIKISLIGFENQTAPESKMPLRVISYDGSSYKQQLLNAKLKKNYPVVTLVLYFGKQHWNKPKALRECLEIPEELNSFVSDYKINVFEIAWLEDETINKFKSDFKFVAQFFQAKRKNKEYKGTNEEIKHVDEIFKLISVLNGDNSFELGYTELKSSEKGGTVTMCEVVQKIEECGAIKYRQTVIQKLLKAGVGNIEQIASWLELPIETVKQAAENRITID